MLGVFAALITAAAPGASVRGLALPAAIAAGTIISIVAAGAFEVARVRMTSNREVLGAVTALGVLGVALAVRLLAVDLLHAAEPTAWHMAVMAGAAAAAGVYISAISAQTVVFDHSVLARRILVSAAVVSSIAYVDATVLHAPMRDARLYLRAGALFLGHHAVYLAAPLASMPQDPTLEPYLYPPFTLPFFGALAMLPPRVAIGLMAVSMAGAVVAGLRLLGVRWSFIPVLLLWPPLEVGIQVGNVACLGFLALAAGWRASSLVPAGGAFKAQTGLVSLWLIRERRWAALLTGMALLAALVLVTLPLTGAQAYVQWATSLVYFQETLARDPAVMGVALQKTLPVPIVALLAIAAVVAALVARGRDGLARFGVASVVISPTVYAHGLALFLPSLLFLDVALLWTLVGVMPWGAGGWWAALIAIGALTIGATRRRTFGDPTRDVPGPGRPGSAEIDLHPIGAMLEPWTDANRVPDAEGPTPRLRSREHA